MTVTQDLNAAVRVTEDWVEDLLQRLGWQDRERVYLALLAALHALRDCLGRDEAVCTENSIGVSLRPDD